MTEHARWENYPQIRRPSISSVWCLCFVILLRGAQSSSLPSGKIYWTDSGHHVIRWADLNGSNAEDLVVRDDSSYPRGLAIDKSASKMYWAEMGGNLIMRASLDGSDVETFVTTNQGPDGLALDATASNLYWTDVHGRVQRMGLQGDVPEGLLEASYTHREGIAVDSEGDWLYYTCADKGYSTIHKAHLDGSEVQHLVTPDDTLEGEEDLDSELYGPKGIALDVGSGKVYWSDTITDKIQRSNLDGSDIEDLVTSGLHSVVGLAIDTTSGKMYWADRGDDTITSKFDAIARANLDGSDVEILISNIHAEPRGIALAL
mmetsp:Transcript_123423/g.310764  ORF Transcript_123423/g.310764 Transcript_123423/m.310764 type:complete len:317 (-) Transcript_123423:55-1005(-)